MAKIMLVEDDNNLRQIYEDRLAAEGYEIVSAPDGEEALALAVKERPDLIIADVMMPKVSGFDMLDILRSTPETKDCKIIMMTALSQAEDKARAEKLGADRYLVKSQVTLEDVAKVAAEILSGEPAGSPAAAAATTAPTTPAATPAPVPTATPAPTTATIPVSAPPAVTPAPAPTTPAATPAPADPTLSPAAPSVQPTSTATTIPVTTPADEPDDTAAGASEEAPADEQSQPNIEAAAQEAASLATPASEEQAAAGEQVDEFIASNPTLTTSVEAPEKTAPTETTDAGTPSTASVPSSQPAPAPESAAPNVVIKVEEPGTNQNTPTPTTPDSAAPGAPAEATSNPSQKVADAVDGLLKETEGTSSDSVETSEKGAAQSYVTDNGSNETQSMVHTKRIEPISDGSVPQTPDLNELLAREGEVAALQPPVNSVISPGNGGSVNAASVDNTPQVNTLAEGKGSEATTPTAGPSVTPPPNSDITL